MKILRSNSVLTGIIMLVVGLWMVIHPGDALVAVVKILGIAMLLLGLVGLISQLAVKKGKSAMGIITSALEILVGLIIVLLPEFVVSIFPFFAGVIIALYGVADVITALKMNRKGAVVLAVLTVVLGVVIFLKPFSTVSTLVRIIGLALVYRAVTGTIIRANMSA